MTYLNYALQLLKQTEDDKSSNTYRVLFALNCYPKGVSYTDLLNHAPSFNQSALSRTLKSCLDRNLISFDRATKLYQTNYFFDISLLSPDRYKWLCKILNSTLIGANITLIRIAIYLVAVDNTSMIDLASVLNLTQEHLKSTILKLTEELGTSIITVDDTFSDISANLSWFV
jgi:hypothetical protein